MRFYYFNTTIDIFGFIYSGTGEINITQPNQLQFIETESHTTKNWKIENIVFIQIFLKNSVNRVHPSKYQILFYKTRLSNNMWNTHQQYLVCKAEKGLMHDRISINVQQTRNSNSSWNVFVNDL